MSRRYSTCAVRYPSESNYRGNIEIKAFFSKKTLSLKLVLKNQESLPSFDILELLQLDPYPRVHFKQRTYH